MKVATCQRPKLCLLIFFHLDFIWWAHSKPLKIVTNDTTKGSKFSFSATHVTNARDENNTSLSFSLSIRWRAEILDTLWALKAMAFLLSNLKPSLLPQTKSKPIFQTLPSAKATTSQGTSLFFTSCATPLSTLQTPTAQVALGSTPTTGAKDEHQQQKDEFYLNLGLAVRTLREDMPLIFVKDLNYDIYRWFSHLGI